MSSKFKIPKGPIAWMAKNHVAANLLMIMVMLGGIAMFTQITQEVFPNILMDTVTVSISYPGASPEEVEKGIVLSVEEALRGLDGVKEVRSTANEGGGKITAELYENSDSMKVYQDIKNEVDRIRTFPEDSEKPIVTLDSRRREVMSIALYGKVNEKVMRELAEQVRDRFLEDPDITQINFDGVRPLEIGIEVSQENLRKYNLTINDIATILKSSSVEIPGGGIKTESGEVLIRVDERRDYGREFAKIPVITTPEGSQVLLEDIATINDGFEDTDCYAIYNGLPAIMFEIYRVGNQTPISVAEAVKKQIKLVEKELPKGIKVAVLRNMSKHYKQRRDLLLRNGMTGLVLVLLLLGLFLELRLAFWVMMGIPVSFLGAIIFMPMFDLSLNVVSMFAFIVSLGIVVDDAIVVGENIYHHHQGGKSFIESAIVGTKEVCVPVSFSIITNIIAFLPLCLLPGRMGKVLWMLPVVVVSAFSISWIESIFILPAHLGNQKDRKKWGINKWLHNFQQKFSKWFIKCVKNWFRPLLELALSYRYLVISIAISIFVFIIGFVSSGRMGFQIFPKVESDYAYVYAVMPYGTPVAKTDKITRKLIKAARKVVSDSGHPELCEGIYANIGKNGGHTTEIKVYLAVPEIRSKIMSTQQFVTKWREETGTLPGVEAVSFLSNRGGPGGGAALTIELKHKSIKVLEQASSELASELSTIATVSDIDDGFQPGKEQIDFKATPLGESLGITPQYIAQRLRNSYEGAEVTRQQRGRNEIKIKVRLAKNERVSEYDLNKMIILTPKGVEAPLNELVTSTRGRAYTSIGRRDGERTVNVTADVKPVSKTGEVIELLNNDILPKILKKHAGLSYSYEGKQADTRESMFSLMIMIPVVLLLIYAMLAIPFRSYVQPAIVMVSIPFGIIGAVLGHLIMGYNMSLISIIGILALSGVVVNDALVLIDFANNKRKEGLPPKEAVLEAGVQRFRPIMLTTLTTFGGLMPMIFETSRQARFLIPMAISLGYGILFATGITLLLVPSLYMLVEDFKGFWKWLWGDKYLLEGKSDLSDASD